MKKKPADKKNIENFPLSKLANNWPFSGQLAEKIFRASKKGYYLSFKKFLIRTWLERQNFSADDSESDSDLDDYLSSETVNDWPNLYYTGFFIENDILYYKESRNNKTYLYSLDKISDKIIIREAIRGYTNYYLKFLIEKEEKGRKIYRQTKLWYVIFCSLLFSRYSSSIKNLLIEEKYLITYKTEMIETFYHVLKTINDSEFHFEVLLKTEERYLRKRFENLFVFSDISPNESKKLIDNFLSTKTLNEILSYQNKKVF